MPSKVAQDRAEALDAESKKEVGEARVARDAALNEEKMAAKHCHEAEASPKALQEDQATHVRRLQQQEHNLKAREAKLADRDSVLSKVTVDQAEERERLAKLKEEVAQAQVSHAKHISEATARMDAKEKILADAKGKAAMEHDDFPSLELRACQALWSICRG